MNLHDLVRRRDRMVSIGEGGGVEAVEPKLPGGTQRGIRLSSGCELVLSDVNEATVFKTFPALPGWHCHLGANASLKVWLRSGGREEVLFEAAGPRKAMEIGLVWPVPVPAKFDLRLEARGGECMVTVGPLFNAKPKLLQKLRGTGVEVGPGANPSVLPDETRSVRYVERMPMEQWAKTYLKRDLDESSASHWEHYVVDSAHELAGFAEGSIDFVFSSHVLEHLVNPIGVLRNWWSKLAPGGVIAGVVPDARFTFDLRQPLSGTSDFLEQLARTQPLGMADRIKNALSGRKAQPCFETTDQMYERWCRYTSPENTPGSLRQRQYSIHVNYFSVETFRLLLDLFALEAKPAGIFMESVTNGRDFGFLVAKP